MECTWKQFGCIEPVFFIYSYWLMLIFPVMSQYTYTRYSEDVDFPYLNVTEGGGCGGKDFSEENSTLKALETEVQTRSANLFTYYMVFAIVPSLLLGPFYGSFSDKRGRKPVILAPLLGALFETGFTLAIMYFRLPLYWLFAGGFVNSASGYFTTIWLSLNAYLADTVENDKLSNRMTLLNFSLFLAGTIAQLTSGLWIENFGFKIPMWFCFGILSLACLYTVLFVKESIKEKVKANFFDPTSVRRMLHIFTKPRKHGRKNLILALMVVGVNVTFTVGTGAVSMLFVLRSPLCWRPSIVGYFLSYRFFLLGAGSVIFIYVLKKCFSEINVTRFGFVSQVAAMLLFAFSTKTWMVFLVPAVSILSAIQDPVLSSIASRIVTTEEQGILFAVSGCIGATGELVGTALFNSIYPLSLQFGFPGFVFMLSAGCSFILLLFTGLFDVRLDVLNKEEIPTMNDDQPKPTNIEGKSETTVL